MRKLILALVFCSCTFLSQAQSTQGETEVGLTAGATMSNLKGDDVETDHLASFNAGVLLRYFISTNLALQAQLYYGGHGAKDENFKLRMQSIFLPILANYYMQSFSLFAGPQINYLLSAKSEYNGQTIDHIDYYKKLQMALVIGAAYMFTQNIGIDARYNFGLGNISEQSGTSIQNSMIMLSLIYLFGKKN